MTSPTHGGDAGDRSADADETSASRAVPTGGADATEGGTKAEASGQASGKQFERGTESVPDHDPDTGTGGLGGGASASGKRFARGTDSDGDGHAYDDPPTP